MTENSGPGALGNGWASLKALEGATFWMIKMGLEKKGFSGAAWGSGGGGVYTEDNTGKRLKL